MPRVQCGFFAWMMRPSFRGNCAWYPQMPRLKSLSLSGRGGPFADPHQVLRPEPLAERALDLRRLERDVALRRRGHAFKLFRSSAPTRDSCMAVTSRATMSAAFATFWGSLAYSTR